MNTGYIQSTRAVLARAKRGQRHSNTLNGCLRGLAAAGAITAEQAQQYVRDMVTPWRRSDTWDELVARFGIHETDNGLWAFNVPTERNM